MAASRVTAAPAPAAWNLAWLTPLRCRALLGMVLIVGFLLHLRYLTHDCPIDLSGDEAQYWDWSRQLDWSYFSKGPLVALIIRASCAVLGDTPLGVRFPALLLAMGTSLITYCMTARLLRNERIALGAVLLNHLVPMFVAGSVLMTIDPPAYFCWALACWMLVEAIFREKSWAWLVMGVALGVGFLAKYVVLLWLLGLVVFFICDRPARKWLKTEWFWLMPVIAAGFTLPVIGWNVDHDWISLQHVAGQTGATSSGRFRLMNVVEFLGGQVAAIGPMLWVILAGAVIWKTGGGERSDVTPNEIAANSHLRRCRNLLACLSLPFWLLIALWSIRTKIQVNWPAPAYFAWMILAAMFLADRLQSADRWRKWRFWFWSVVIGGIIITPMAHNTEILYKPLSRFALLYKPLSRFAPPRAWDPTFRLRGWNELGAAVSGELRKMPRDSFVMAELYDRTAALAFYVPGIPRAYYVGSWLSDPRRRGRYTQYDLWPEYALDRPELLGKDAIYLGYKPDGGADGDAWDLFNAFESVERLPDVTVERGDVEIRKFELWRMHGFKGMQRPAGAGKAAAEGNHD